MTITVEAGITLAALRAILAQEQQRLLVDAPAPDRATLGGIYATNTNGPRRFGLRQHFRRAAWSRFVEVHFTDGIEAYVTPAGAARIGVAFLWEHNRRDNAVSFQNLLARFPMLGERLRGGDFRVRRPVRGLMGISLH